MTCLNCCQQQQKCCGRAPRQVLSALCKLHQWQPHSYHASAHCYVTAVHARSCLASICHLSNAIQTLRASNTMSACLPMKSTSAWTEHFNIMSACRPVKSTSAWTTTAVDRSQGGCCLCAGQSVVSAAPVGGAMAAGALLVLDSASQPHCLWPNRAPTAPEVSAALHEHHTDTIF